MFTQSLSAAVSCEIANILIKATSVSFSLGEALRKSQLLAIKNLDTLSLLGQVLIFFFGASSSEISGNVASPYRRGRLSGLPFKRRILNASRRLPHCRLPLLRRLPLGRACSWDLTHVTLRLELLTHPQTPGFSRHKVHLMLALQALCNFKLSYSPKVHNAQNARLALTLQPHHKKRLCRKTSFILV